MVGTRRRVLSFVVIFVLGAAAFGTGVGSGLGASARAAASGCNNATVSPGNATASELRKAILCLVNKARTSRNRAALKVSDALRSAAERHNRYMLDHECFAHECPGEATLARRVARSGYMRGAKSGAEAENLSLASTPRDVVRGWLHSSQGHRETMLSSRYRDIGVAAKRGCPDDERVGLANCPDRGLVTVTAVFARRGPPAS